MENGKIGYGEQDRWTGHKERKQEKFRHFLAPHGRTDRKDYTDYRSVYQKCSCCLIIKVELTTRYISKNNKEMKRKEMK